MHDPEYSEGSSSISNEMEKKPVAYKIRSENVQKT
jgi:hypothetical protein